MTELLTFCVYVCSYTDKEAYQMHCKIILAMDKENINTLTSTRDRIYPLDLRL
jgi:hypothetical protein